MGAHFFMFFFDSISDCNGSAVSVYVKFVAIFVLPLIFHNSKKNFAIIRFGVYNVGMGVPKYL